MGKSITQSIEVYRKDIVTKEKQYDKFNILMQKMFYFWINACNIFLHLSGSPTYTLLFLLTWLIFI